MKDCSTTNKLMISDDNIISLENSIDSLKEIIQKFNLSKNPSSIEKDTFFEEYIHLEDKILNELESLKSQSIEDDRLAKLVDEFNKIWSEYQDTWNDEYWEAYDNRRALLEQQAIGINFTKFNEEELSNNNFVFVNNNQVKEYVCYVSTNNSNNLNHNLNNETFNKIDNELEKLEENYLPKKDENKDRSCVKCIVF